MSEPLTLSALDAAVAILKASDEACALKMDPRWFWLVVNPWSYEYMLADRRKARRMLRKRGRAKEAMR